MRFTLKKPCDTCPFLRKGGVRLSRARVWEIASAMLDSQGATFACHKTTLELPDDDGSTSLQATPESQHCAGALMFAEKNLNATQAMRIAERLRLYDARALMANKDALEKVFDSVEEMMQTAWRK